MKGKETKNWRERVSLGKTKEEGKKKKRRREER